MLMRARYKTTLPTYTDGIADELQMDSSGRLLVAVSGAGDITDDSAFTPGTSEVSVIGAFADMTTPDSVDEGDAGALRMTLDRKLLVALYGEVSAGGDTSIKMGTGNAAPAQTVARVYTTALGALRDSSAALIRPILTQSSTADASDGTVFSGSGLMGFNGTTWDRLRSEGNDRDDIAVGTLGNLQTINFNHAYDQSAGNWNRVRDAAGVGDGGTGPGTLSVAPLAFNGTTYDRLRTEGNDRESVAATTLGLLQNVNYPMVWDNTASDYNRAQSAAADGLSGTTLYGAGNVVYDRAAGDWNRADAAADDGLSGDNIPAVGLMGFDGTDFDRLRAVSDASDALGAGGGNRTLATVSKNTLFNGSSFDRARGNEEGTALASAVRTATTLSAALTNYNASAAIFMVEVTVNPGSAETLKFRVLHNDPVSGDDVILYETATSTFSGTVGYAVLHFGPGAVTAGYGQAGWDEEVQLSLPRDYKIQVVHSASGSWTYSVSYALIV